MAFWTRFFRKKTEHEANPEDNWDSIVFDSDKIDFDNEEERSRYITNCLEQIAEASKEINLLTEEYTLVTSYLKDIEEMEALPKADRATLDGIAQYLVTLDRECEKYRGKENRMRESEYQQMRKQEEEVQQGIEKLKESEKYDGLVKQDLRRLSKERNAYEIRRTELEASLVNYRGMTIIFLVAFLFCVVILAIFQFALKMDTKVGYLIAVGAVAASITVLMNSYTNRQKELKKVDNTINRLIQLQNKVKIRYVNNNNLLNYLKMKYDAKNAEALEKRWAMYQVEKEERKMFAEAEAKREYYQNQLIAKLRNYRITDIDRWVNQPEAFLDKREIVEMRHELILQRQALRKQMDYNTTVADNARAEIMHVVKLHSEYATEIMTMVDRYEEV